MPLGLRAENSFAMACVPHAILITPHKAPAAVWGCGGDNVCAGMLKIRNKKHTSPIKCPRDLLNVNIFVEKKKIAEDHFVLKECRNFATSYCRIMFNGPRMVWRYGVKKVKTEVLSFLIIYKL